MLREIARVDMEVYERSQDEVLSKYIGKDAYELSFDEKVEITQYGLDVDNNQIFVDEKNEKLFVYDLVNVEMLHIEENEIKGIMESFEHDKFEDGDVEVAIL